jgi:hypothetical protein
LVPVLEQAKALRAINGPETVVGYSLCNCIIYAERRVLLTENLLVQFPTSCWLRKVSKYTASNCY